MGLNVGAVHHIVLTVTDPERSKKFYMDVLGLQHAADLGEKIALAGENLLLVINPPPDPSHAPGDDRFSEHRCGLDHVSFSVANRAALEDAAQLFDERGIEHGEIKDLSPVGFPILVLAFRDPDNIQLELTAPVDS